MIQLSKEQQDILEHIAIANDPQYNRDKVLEELHEFGEVILKLRTKNDSNPRKPAKEELIKEFGDLLYRGIIYLIQEFPSISTEDILELFERHIEQKLEMLKDLKVKKYHNL